MIRLTGTPISDAACWLKDTARIAVPILVEQQGRDQRHDDVVAAHHQAAELELLLRKQLREGAGGGAEDRVILATELDKERYPDRRDQHRELGPLAQRAVSEELDQHADAGTHHRGQRDHDDGTGRRLRAHHLLHLWCDVEGREGAEHQHVAMREVDEAEHAIDHRVAEGDQRIDRSEPDAVDELLDRLLEIHGREVAAVRRALAGLPALQGFTVAV
jgi:hypothetical protein